MSVTMVAVCLCFQICSRGKILNWQINCYQSRIKRQFLISLPLISTSMVSQRPHNRHIFIGWFQDRFENNLYLGGFHSEISLFRHLILTFVSLCQSRMPPKQHSLITNYVEEDLFIPRPCFPRGISCPLINLHR